jgi:hypothetical protein
MMIRSFRLTNEPGGLGLSCSPAGLALAGVPLLAKTAAGFEPRPASEITALLKAAYGANGGSILLQSSLEAIAQALNNGDFGLAAIAAVQMRIRELSFESDARVAQAEEKLSKYNYNPSEPRDWHGRWTRDGSAGPVNLAPGSENDQRTEPHVFDPRQRVAENASSPAALSDSEGGDASGKLEDSDDSGEATSLEQTFERKYDDLGPVDFAKEVIQFGDWLGRNGAKLSPAEMAYALAEYSFLQDRLSAWLAYDYKPPQAQGNLLSAALTLYQGAFNGGIVGARHLPESMLAVAGTASLFGGGAPSRPPKSSIEDPLFVPGKAPKRPTAEDEPFTPAQAAKEIEGLGGIVDRSETGIEWNKGIKEQNGKWEDYYDKTNPDSEQLPPGSKRFDHFNATTGEATSNKTLNTLSMSYIRDPLEIYRKVTRYVADAVNYQRRMESEPEPDDIVSKTIQLAVPEYTSPTQWRHLLRAVIYGEDNGVSIVITRIRG